MDMNRPNTEKDDTAYLFVKDIFARINKNWRQIRIELEKPWPLYDKIDEDAINKNRTIVPDDTRGCRELALAAVSMEISCIPREIMEEEGEKILDGIFDALKASAQDTAIDCDYVERVRTYLDLMGFHPGCGLPSKAKDGNVLYYLYRNMKLRNRNGWSDLFLASKLREILHSCIKGSWSVFR